MSEKHVDSPMSQQVLLLRHGEVDSHRGDVSITHLGVSVATEVGRRLGAQATGPLLILTGETLRTRQTADAIRDGVLESGAEVIGPRVSFALRNPDLYVAGQRVNMVSSMQALAAQLDEDDETIAQRSPFFQGFLTAQDRIGFWLENQHPPGEDYTAVANRIRAFAASFADTPQAKQVIAITHSPILRAVTLKELGEDSGEPNWLAGLQLNIDACRSVSTTLLSDAP